MFNRTFDPTAGSGNAILVATISDTTRTILSPAEREFFDHHENRDLDRLMRANRNRSFS